MDTFIETPEEMEKVNVVIRSFQSGVDRDSFDVELFQDKIVKTIERLLQHKDIINSIVIVTNAEEGNVWAEKLIGDDMTPTVENLHKTFPQEIKDGVIVTHIVRSGWGSNPGSGEALNQGIGVIKDDCKWVLLLSAEMEMDGYRIVSAINFARERDLSVVGFMRKKWWERPQWNLGQNTACLWNINALRDVGGFARECDGTGETVFTQEYGDVPMAGMEDFHAMLQLMKKYGEEFRWGMIGRFAPLQWNVNFAPGSEREKNHKIKVARQYIVIQRYAEKVFPHAVFEDVMEKFFSLRHQD